MSAIVPATFPVAAHAAPKPVVRIDVTLYNRTKGFEKTAQFATWMTTSRPNPGPIKTVHISNCMFNLTTGAHKLHKEFVKMKAGAYYYLSVKSSRMVKQGCSSFPCPPWWIAALPGVVLDGWANRGAHGTLRGPPAALGRVVRAFLATTVRTVRNGNERGCWE